MMDDIIVLKMIYNEWFIVECKYVNDKINIGGVLMSYYCEYYEYNSSTKIRDGELKWWIG
jgi:hypothetical protein